jgi:hypothetical protein
MYLALENNKDGSALMLYKIFGEFPFTIDDLVHAIIDKDVAEAVRKPGAKTTKFDRAELQRIQENAPAEAEKILYAAAANTAPGKKPALVPLGAGAGGKHRFRIEVAGVAPLVFGPMPRAASGTLSPPK